jgi:hypothetical protein
MAPGLTAREAATAIEARRRKIEGMRKRLGVVGAAVRALGPGAR